MARSHMVPVRSVHGTHEYGNVMIMKSLRRYFPRSACVNPPALHVC